MTELERKALLGDTEAQKQCTELGIILPCPICGGGSKSRISKCWRPKVSYNIMCTKCYTNSGWYDTEKEAIAEWNTRTAPPVGCCEDCRYFAGSMCKKAAPHYIRRVYKSFYCKGFKPKETTDDAL